MRAIEFTAELSGSDTLTLPPDIARRLRGAGLARFIVLTAEASDSEAGWRTASYEQFVADDAPEDAIYGSSRASRRSVVDVLAELPGHLTFQTAAEVDAYLREERAAWER